MTQPTRIHECWNTGRSWLRTVAGTLMAILVAVGANSILQAIRYRRDDKE